MLRYFLLGTHYRSPLDFSDKSIEEAKKALNGFYDLFTRLKEPDQRVTADKELMEVIDRCKVAFREAMDDDFNTSMAIAELQRLKNNVNKLLEGLSTAARNTAKAEFQSLGNTLGLFQLDKWQFVDKSRSGHIVVKPGTEHLKLTTFAPTVMVGQVSHENELSEGQADRSAVLALTNEEIEGKRLERDEARKQKNFKKADEIRQFLASHGIVIEDKPDGTSRWKR
jgi:cysteinyl-tRNA synthetase